MKTQTLQIRLRSDEKQSFENAAELAGMPVSAWVRSRLRKAAINELSEAGKQIAFLQREYERGEKE